MKNLKIKNIFFLILCSFLFSSKAQVCLLPRVDYTFPGTPGNVYRPIGIATADFNNDGKQDIAIANDQLIYGVSAFLGTGTGSFTPVGANYTMGYAPQAIVSGDFNNDGKIDVATIGTPSGTNIVVSLLKGTGSGSFLSAVSYTTLANASVGGFFLNKGDYNGDGYLDLTYLKLASPNSTLTCMLGDGLGAFSTITSFTISGGGSGLKFCTADFNKDGKSDVAVTAQSPTTLLLIKFGASTLPLALTNTYTGVNSTSGKMLALDVNGDTNQDIAMPNGTFISVMLGSPTGTFSAVTSYTTGGANNYITAADYNLDGFDDLAVTSSGNKIKTFNGSNTGVLIPSYDYTGNGNDIISAEFTTDAKPDIITVSRSTDLVSVFKSGLQSFSVNSGTICSGKSFTINATGAVSYSYSGGTTVTPPTSTIYTVTASFLEGCNNTNTSLVTVLPTPTISISNGTVCTGYSHTIIPNGANSYTYSNGSVVTPTINSTYTVNGTALNGCTSSSTLSVIVIPIQTPSICLITLDSIVNNNEIYWEKSLYTNVDSFIIYREVSTNVYKQIGAVSVNAFSMYLDTNRSIGPANGNPNFTSYKYKLQIRNTCGTYGVLSLWHQTIFVQDQLNGNFNWNNYAIENATTTPVSNYNLQRYNLSTGIETLVGSTTSNLFTDPQYATFWPTNTKWFVDAVGFNCNPTLKTMNTTAIKNKTKSNTQNERLATGLKIKNFNNSIFSVYPNPATNVLNVNFENLINSNTTIEITTVIGEIVIQQTIQSQNTIINVQHLVKGIYFINLLNAKKTIAVKKIIIE